jgi:hypothetical protein
VAVTTDSIIARFINYLDADIGQLGIGDGVTPLTPSNTSLDNELLRKATTNVIDGNTLIVEGYWDETEANGVSYTEAGCFGNGETSTINTGELISGDAIAVTKDNTQTLTVSIEINVEAINT